MADDAVATSKPSEFSEEERRKILAQAQTFWALSGQMMDPFFRRVNQLERLARVLLPEDLAAEYEKYPDRAALVPPDVHNNLNSLRAHIRAFLFKKKPYFPLSVVGKPGDRSEAVQKAEYQLQSILDQANDGRGFPSTAKKLIYQALYAGVSCSFLRYTKNYQRVPVRDPQTLQLVTKEGRVQFEYKPVSEYPESIPYDIRRCRFDTKASSFSDMRIVGVQSIMPFSQLQRLNAEPSSIYSFDEKALYKSSFQKSKYFEYVKSEADMYSGKATDDSTMGDKPIEVWSIRGLFKFDVQGGVPVYRDLIVEVGNQSILMAAKVNDLPIEGWNLFDWPACDEQTDRLFPMGVVEPAMDGMIEQFVKENQSIDSANRNVYVSYVGDSGACADLPPYIESSNDRIIKVDVQSSQLSGVNQVLAPLIRPPLGQDTFVQGQWLSKRNQQTMRLSDYMQGVTPDRTETATGVSEITSGGQVLTDDLIENLADTYFKPLSRKLLVLWNFFNADKTHTVMDNRGSRWNIAPGEIDLPYVATVDTNMSATSPAMIRRFVEMYPLLANDPWVDPQVLRETMVDVLALPNAARLIPPKDYLQMQVDRENAALGYGIELPVHELDNHSLHLRVHVEYLKYLQGLSPEQVQAEGITMDSLIQHITEHQAIAAQLSGAALGNTKEFGGNAGTLVQPDMARSSVGTGGKTGQYMPSEARR